MPKLVELQFSKTAASLRRLVIFCLPVSGSLRTTNYGSLGQRDSWYICMYVYICILTKTTDGMLWKKQVSCRRKAMHYTLWPHPYAPSDAFSFKRNAAL